MRSCSGLNFGLAALFLSVSTLGAQALPPLKENPRVRHEMLAGEVGYQIQKYCPTIGPRILRAAYKLNKLKDYARSLGYSDAQIDALGDDKAAKAELNAMRDDYLASHGVTEGDVESYCRLGLEEIEKNSLTGWLLRAN